MDSQNAKTLVIEAFENGFNRTVFLNFVRNLVKKFDEAKAVHFRGYVKDKFKKNTQAIKTYERLGTYTDLEGKTIDILIVYLEKDFSLDYARTTLRNFVAEHLKDRNEKDAALVAFVPPQSGDWRFSLVKMEYQLEKSDKGRLKAKTKLTPAKRFSFLVGENENSYTAKNQFLPLLTNDQPPLLSEFETAFNVEKVTKEFFAKYRELFNQLKDSLDNFVSQNDQIKMDFQKKKIDTVDFAKKLLGQIVFLYFLQKKGWFGVERDKEWGTGSKQFLRQLFDGKHGQYENFFNDILEPLFYQALRTDRSFDDHYFSQFNCKIPFLNGGLFDPINDYDWIKTDILLPNDLFSNNRSTKEGDIGDGILDIFDRYNFTVKEDEPLEKEVAIDPEMLGKVFENLLAVKDRKSKGTYYTPREIVHYMCKQSLINYLVTELNGKVEQKDIETLIKYGETTVEHDKEASDKEKTAFKLPKDVVKHAQLIDKKLADIRACDPAVGSGAFLVGMMSEIIKARNALTSHLKNKQNRTLYDFKRQAIEKSLYGVDIDLGAVEIAKLRLWLSLIVDEEDIKQIKPLPNLDYKIMQGNSLIEYINPGTLAKNNDPERTKLIRSFNQAKDEYQTIYEPGLKKAKRDKINKLIEDIMIYDKKRQIETDKAWRKFQEKQQENLFGENTKQLALGGMSEKEKEKIKQQDKEFNQLKSLSPIDHFEWHLNFNEVFDLKGGFDIQIANPPYIDSESMVKKDQGKLREQIQKTYVYTKGNWDIYIAFFELAFKLVNNNGNLTFITPDKWISKPFGDELRKSTVNNIYLIVKAGRKVFEDAKVDSILSFFSKKQFQTIRVIEFKNKSFIEKREVNKKILKQPFTLDWLFSDFFDFVIKIDSIKLKLLNFGHCESACATSDAYKLAPFIKETFEFRNKLQLKIINTGTIAKYFPKWGMQEMTYLGKKYNKPIVFKKEFFNSFKNSYSKKSNMPKLIIKGLNLLDACLDSNGDILPGKSTLIITSKSLEKLKLLLGLINSKLAFFYLKEKYIASSYNQGISFTPEMLNNFPLPVIGVNEEKTLIKNVDSILKITSGENYNPKNPPQEQKLLESKIDQMVYKLYELTPEEIKIVKGGEKND